MLLISSKFIYYVTSAFQNCFTVRWVDLHHSPVLDITGSSATVLTSAFQMSVALPLGISQQNPLQLKPTKHHFSAVAFRTEELKAHEAGTPLKFVHPRKRTSYYLTMGTVPMR